MNSDYFVYGFLGFIFIGLPLLNWISDKFYIYRNTRDMSDIEKEIWLEEYYESTDDYNCEF